MKYIDNHKKTFKTTLIKRDRFEFIWIFCKWSKSNFWIFSPEMFLNWSNSEMSLLWYSIHSLNTWSWHCSDTKPKVSRIEKLIKSDLSQADFTHLYSYLKRPTLSNHKFIVFENRKLGKFVLSSVLSSAQLRVLICTYISSACIYYLFASSLISSCWCLIPTCLCWCRVLSSRLCLSLYVYSIYACRFVPIKRVLLFRQDITSVFNILIIINQAGAWFLGKLVNVAAVFRAIARLKI